LFYRYFSYGFRPSLKKRKGGNQLKKLLLTLTIALFVSSFAFAGFERSLHNQLDVNSPAAMNLEGGLVFDYISIDGDVNAWVLDAYVKYGIMDNWEIGFDVPYLNISPDEGDSQSGIGDMNIWTKYRFLDESKNCMGLAAGVNVKLATGDEDEGLGSGETDWMPFIMATFKPADQFVLGAKVGYDIIGEPEGVEVDDSWVGTIWGGYMVKPNVGIVAELHGNTQEGKDPLSLDAGITYGASENVGLTAGAGVGLNDAAADWHIFAAIKGFMPLGK
jgi:hypothetical protein